MNIQTSFKISGNIVDVINRKIFPGTLTIVNSRIKHIQEDSGSYSNYILPGFVDAHIHIESSMLVPYEFARVALIHGTVATVSDPHEIANVCGIDGVMYMLENAEDALLKFNFGAPSCVPATRFETAGAVVDVAQIEQLMARDDIRYLSEMMNYPGVLFKHKEVMLKIAAAHKHDKPIDGHAPGLRGEQAKQYIDAGISTDHECFTLEEASDKLSYGMKIIIREGSAAKNFEALHTLISTYTDQVMLCSDDKHPDDLLMGHVNLLVKRALEKGHDIFNVLKCACINPVIHYGLEVGMLREGDFADFIVTDNLEQLNILQTFVNGECVAENGKSVLKGKSHPIINSFKSYKVSIDDIKVESGPSKIKVIEAIDGQLITNCILHEPYVVNGFIDSDVKNDVLKIVVANRYRESKPVVGFIKNFGLKNGAIASTVAHDSHNIIAVGVADADIAKAIDLLMQSGGGLCAVNNKVIKTVALPVAGLMSDKPCDEIGNAYAQLSNMAQEMGSALKAPYMTLSFMALLVIPHFKIGDLGLFDGDKFQLTTLSA